ncbi:MAG TPA: DUF2837 family protein [Bacteroidia bacterium]|nr:DUF2837 family protein [Bacteroidia bacterium]
MDSELFFLCCLVVAINVVSTLSYAVRIAGVRTGRIAFALSLFNLLVLFSRSSNAILAPLLSKRTEQAIASVAEPDPGDFRVLLVAAAVGSLIGSFLIPTFQRLVARAVQRFDRRPSMGALLLTAANPRNWWIAAQDVAVPNPRNVALFGSTRRLPWLVFALNVGGTAMITCGVFSSLYAGYLVPELRLTAGNLSALVNFIGTILMFALVDPHFSYLSDKVVSGEVSQGYFRAVVVGMTGSRFVGCLVAQVILVPGAWAIAKVAEWI